MNCVSPVEKKKGVIPNVTSLSIPVFLGSFMKSCNAMQYFEVYSALFLNMFMSNIYYNYSYH